MMFRIRTRGTNDYCLIDSDKIIQHAPCVANNGTFIIYRDDSDNMKHMVIADSYHEFEQRLAETKGELVELPL